MSTTPLLGSTAAAQQRISRQLCRTWSATIESENRRFEDYTSIVFNLHAWSYRLTQQEFSEYEKRAEVRSAACAAGRQYTTGISARDGLLPGLQQRNMYTIYNKSFAGSSRCLVNVKPPKSFLGLTVVPVTHPFMAAWSMLMLTIDMTYTAVLLPLLFAFNLLNPTHWSYWLSVAVGFMFLADLLVVLHRGVVVRYLDRHIYINDPQDVLKLYVHRGTFWTDLPIALSGPLQLLALLPSWGTSSRLVAVVVNTLLLMRGLRLLKLMLLSRELFFGKMGFRHMGHSLYRWYMLSLVYVLGVLINWLACTMLCISNVEGQEHSWLTNVRGDDLSAAPGQVQYMAAFYWMLISTLTVGYGDISAATPAEQAAVVAAVIAGVLFIGYAIKSLMDIMVESALQDENAQRIATLRGRAAELKLWTNWQDLPQQLVEPMYRYFMGPWLTNQVMCRHWGGVLQDLPAQLRGQVLQHILVDKHKELSPLGTRLLANIPLSAAWHVLALLKPHPLAPGQQLCWEGETAEYLWFLQEGTVVKLTGVVPNPLALIDQPGPVIAYDAVAWIQQQWQRLHQHRQPQSHHGDNSHTHQQQQEGGHYFRHHNQHLHQQPRHQQEAEVAQQTTATAAPNTSSPTETYTSGSSSDNAGQHAAPRQPRHGLEGARHLSAGSTSSTHSKHTASVKGRQTLPVQGSITGTVMKYSCSYQTVTTCFFWALPLHQLSLAIEGLPQLLHNLEKELLARQ